MGAKPRARTMSIDTLPGKLLDNRDGSLIWGSKGNAVRGNFPNAAAAPATVSGESFVIGHWECRSGSTDISFTQGAQGTWCDLVRCDVPLTSYRGLTMSSCINAAKRRRIFLLASTFLVPVLSLGISAARAQQAAPEQLPPIEVSPPADENRTRARPGSDEGAGARRVAPNLSQTGSPNGSPPSDAQTSNVTAN